MNMGSGVLSDVAKIAIGECTQTITRYPIGVN